MPKKTLTLDETIIKMMLNYPAQYQSRVDALLRIFTDSWEWEHGDGNTIVPDAVSSDPTNGGMRVPGKTWDEDKEAGQRGGTASQAHGRLFARRENAKEQFVIDNADLLAIEEHSNFSYAPTFSISDANHLPLKTMDPIWLAGLKELCSAIIGYDEKRVILHHWDHAPECAERAKLGLVEAKATAKEVVARLAPVENPDKARQQQIAELRRQAAKLGLALVEGTPETLSAIF